MQISPHRVQLAGIQTSPVSYQRLVRTIEAVGFVRAVERPSSSEGVGKATVLAQFFERDIPFIAEGQRAEVSSEAVLASPAVGAISPIDPAQPVHSGTLQLSIDLNTPPQALRPGMTVLVRVRVPAADMEPFCSMPHTPPAIEPGSLREVFVCSEHPDVLKTNPGNCPLGKNRLDRRTLGSNERVDWWCPMHPKVTSDSPGTECSECNGMKLLPRVTTFTPVGEVLALPESAVIDTGARKVVYVERVGGLFEGIEVVLGPRCGEYYPVIRGVEAGQRVATSGAFLIDAESRLNPAAAASYFGAAPSGANP
jgi:Cu(I)/Ag(I) efflux system membrane fusion protein